MDLTSSKLTCDYARIARIARFEPQGKSTIEWNDTLDDDDEDEDLESALLRHRHETTESLIPRCRGEPEVSSPMSRGKPAAQQDTEQSTARIATEEQNTTETRSRALPSPSRSGGPKKQQGPPKTQQSATTAATEVPETRTQAPPPPPKKSQRAKTQQKPTTAQAEPFMQDPVVVGGVVAWARSLEKKPAVGGGPTVQAEARMPELPPKGPKGVEARPSTAWREAQMPGHGAGIVAARDIARGEMVMEELPLLKTSPPCDVGTEAHTKWIRKLVALELSADDRRDFMNLCCTTKERTAEAIFKVNTFEVRGALDVVYRDISRMNHSCMPNCAHSWDDVRCVGQIRALRKIDLGEELLLTYTDLCRPRAARQAFLKEIYGFDCDCFSCREGGEVSDFRRQAIRQCADLLQPHGIIVQIFSKASEEAENPKETPGLSRADKQKEKRLRAGRQKKLVLDAEAARELGLRLAVQLLRLVEAEQLEGVGDVAAHVCEAAAFLLAGHKRQQQAWCQECLERSSIGSSCADVDRAEKALWTIANQPKIPALGLVSAQAIESLGDPRQAVTGNPALLVEPALFDNTSELLMLCHELADEALSCGTGAMRAGVMPQEMPLHASFQGDLSVEV